jgi:hypothetical protein
VKEECARALDQNSLILTYKRGTNFYWAMGVSEPRLAQLCSNFEHRH